jgi:cation diffusion facilitator CzcD-associated flavoprotein CzcO
MTVDPPPQKLNDANNKNMNNAAAATVSASVHCAASKAKIAVIGAGAAGLAAARVATRNSDTDASSSIVTVFEADPNKVGGIWQYEPQSKSKPMYAGLRTNLPKEVMQYREKTWTQPTDASFLRHDQVASYLEDYTRTFNLLPFIRFGSTVKQLTLAGLDDDDNVSLLSPRNERWPKVRMCWDTRTDDNDDSQSSSSSSSSDIFDAVFICNGHYAAPSTPNLPGLTEYFRGRTMHSVAYDDPKDFSGQTVLCVGGRASGSDLAREISFFADKVYLSDTTCSNPSWINGCEDEPRSSDQSTCPVIWVPKTVSVRQDGTIQFEGCDDEMNPMVDTIVFCSGYDYSFPFINDKSNLDLSVVPGERRVAPLYEQLVRTVSEKKFDLLNILLEI